MTASVIVLGTIDRETLKRFHIQEAQSAFVDALRFGVDEDELIQELFEAQIKWQRESER